ncbi:MULTISPECIES: hypothetical protein [unclassified Variovorax]|uniref:hypothetical protein n=1 Tax=unclassified Variovorax TaxID=663243 RepID=UPI001319516C|nr:MULTISPECIES: hypothetical protein [unclassified Variovorax]VTU42977.1 hypothetical protein SRS16P1_00406 [Variovorax sp. SRS16]VTU43009.1 hypothetical protein E5P1_00404 [Variovorax sp. PBL-E5]VTU43541.1 hypothetical protein H6P1_00500 [Variovorax sp. PBL-H6]
MEASSGVVEGPSHAANRRDRMSERQCVGQEDRSRAADSQEGVASHGGIARR